MTKYLQASVTLSENGSGTNGDVTLVKVWVLLPFDMALGFAGFHADVGGRTPVPLGYRSQTQIT